MPKSGSIDIPHVTVHDHYIRKPITKKDKQAIKQFIGLYAINDKQPSNLTKAKAYLNQYEKFEKNPIYLDSAYFYLSNKTNSDFKTNFEALIQLHFIKNDFNQIITHINKLSDAVILQELLIKQTYSNDHAWTCYRIGEALYNTNNIPRAITYLKRAVTLAPFALDFKNKLGAALAANNQLPDAEKLYTEIITEYPKHVSALTNLGYIALSKGNISKAEKYYTTALALDPDYEPLLLNIAGLYAYKKDFKKSKQFLEQILRKNPSNMQAKQALQQIKNFI
jgi:Flp pilus assembly protein TadD